MLKLWEESNRRINWFWYTLTDKKTVETLQNSMTSIFPLFSCWNFISMVNSNLWRVGNILYKKIRITWWGMTKTRVHLNKHVPHPGVVAFLPFICSRDQTVILKRTVNDKKEGCKWGKFSFKLAQNKIFMVCCSFAMLLPIW